MAALRTRLAQAGAAASPGWAARSNGGRRGAVPADSRPGAWERTGIRIVCPGDPEWPTQLDVLGDARPLVLWLRGSADLRFACLRSVSVVGARAATGYGQHVATEMAAALAERGWAVVSGGTYCIDKSAPSSDLGNRPGLPRKRAETNDLRATARQTGTA
jgi:predicted Rossmann fold nucleotide-binding protein DprA/Smf involved in DNA uptake